MYHSQTWNSCYKMSRRNCVNSFTALHVYLVGVCYSQAHKRIYGSHDLVVYIANREAITRKIRSFFSYLFTASTVYLASSSLATLFWSNLIRVHQRGRDTITVLRHSQATKQKANCLFFLFFFLRFNYFLCINVKVFHI